MHKPVLLKESIDGLELRAGATFLDGTLGAGGHSREVLRRFPSARIIALDRDPEALERNKDLEIEVRLESFANLDKVLYELGVASLDAVLLDLGFSSDQLESGRGFSFLKDEPLDMRMSASGHSAADILNSWDESAIELVLRGFGEERLSKRIAHEIVKRRETKTFKTTFDLVDAVLTVSPKKPWQKIHPATKTFQALRIAVNAELSALEEALPKAWKVLAKGGKLAVISFHSLEDRIVKNFFREKALSGEGELATKKPMTATEEELKENPRARSAKLRIIKKL